MLRRRPLVRQQQQQLSSIIRSSHRKGSKWCRGRRNPPQELLPLQLSSCRKGCWSNSNWCRLSCRNNTRSQHFLRHLLTGHLQINLNQAKWNQRHHLPKNWPSWRSLHPSWTRDCSLSRTRFPKVVGRKGRRTCSRPSTKYCGTSSPRSLLSAESADHPKRKVSRTMVPFTNLKSYSRQAMSHRSQKRWRRPPRSQSQSLEHTKPPSIHRHTHTWQGLGQIAKPRH